MMKIERYHFTAPYILDPQHPVTIEIVGAGGTGSQMLTQLARIDQALKRLGHVGIHVTCFDPDTVTESNLARQLFSPADIGLNKAVVLITRLNLFFGTSWEAMPRKYLNKLGNKDGRCNMVISCVDNVETRAYIWKCLDVRRKGLEPYQKLYYWMDLGNTQTTGQFVIGSYGEIEQPAKLKRTKAVSKISCVFEKFPDFAKQKTTDTGPSCSLAEALSKQDLFINSTLSQLAANCIWKMFREGKINYHGAFINLKTLDIAPIYL